MSTLTIAAPRMCRAHHRVVTSGRGTGETDSPRWRLTRRGRLVLSLGSLLVAGLVASSSLIGGAVTATANPVAGQAPAGWVTYVVQPGDTLWGLASQAAGGGDPRHLVAEIREANALPDSALRVGQPLVLPVG